jgi:LmbE family N-acetylglucosaminyl deacetylase
MAVGAHPDDIEFMMAGTLLLLKDRGWELHYLNLCNGSCGTQTETAEAIVAARRLEAQSACRLVGAVFHESVSPDIELFHTTERIAGLVAVIRRVQPTILLVPSPNDYMEDHMNASRLAVTAAFCRGMRNGPCRPAVPPVAGDVYLYHALPYGLRDGLRRRVRPGFYANVASVLERKRAMLACHVSQKEWLDKSQGRDAYLDDLVRMAAEVGRMSGRFTHAEGWRRHSHLGFSVQDRDLLAETLGSDGWTDPDYEADLEKGQG